MDLKGLIADQMGMFTPYDIVGALIAVTLAALLGLVLGRFVQGPADPAGRELMGWAALAAMAVLLVRASVPLAIAMVGVALFVRTYRDPVDRRAQVLQATALVFGLGCGSGAGIITVACAVPVILLLRRSMDRSRG